MYASVRLQIAVFPPLHIFCSKYISFSFKVTYKQPRVVRLSMKRWGGSRLGFVVYSEICLWFPVLFCNAYDFNLVGFPGKTIWHIISTYFATNITMDVYWLIYDKFWWFILVYNNIKWFKYNSTTSRAPEISLIVSHWLNMSNFFMCIFP